MIKFNMILFPAYGRYYETKRAALSDWNAGKDFKIVGGPYCSIRDIKTMRERHNDIYIVYGDEKYVAV